MPTPGIYLLDGDLFVATAAPECFKPGCPGVRLRALRGHFLSGGDWKGSGTVDCDTRTVTEATGEDIVLKLTASAPADVRDILLNGPSDPVDDAAHELESLMDPDEEHAA